MLKSKVIEEYLSTSEEKTKLFSKSFSKKLKKGDVVCFFGDLGSGKTTFIKGMLQSLNNTKEYHVTSPTFTYLNIYSGSIDVYHFDLYRIQNEKHFLDMGFYEYLLKDGICLIEWAEKITPLIPSNAYMVHLLNTEEEKNRQIVVLET